MKLVQNDGVSDLTPVTLSSRDGASVTEDWLQQLIFDHPELLPVEEIDPVFGPPIALCRELPTPAGPVDIGKRYFRQ